MQDGQCQSGYCVDGACCADRCDALCNTCIQAETGVASGTCALVLAGRDPGEKCADVSACNGAGGCNPVKIWKTPVLIESGDVGSASSPRVATDAAGNAIAAWDQSDASGTNIWANRYTTGIGWGAATLIESENAGAAFGTHVAMDAGGNAMVVWQQSDGTRTNIWANRYTAGTGWDVAALIEADNAGGAFSPRVAMDGASNAIAVWHQYDGARSSIWANRYAVGIGWGVATLIETDNIHDAWYPGVAVDGAGNAMAVWEQSDGTRDNIWANRYTAGTTWGVATLIEVDNAGDARHPQVATDAAGNVVAVWHQSDGTRDNIWANRYTPGAGWGTASLIEVDNAGDGRFPDVVGNAAGNFMAVWYQSDGTRDNIWANRYTAGTAWGAASLIEVDSAGEARSPRVAMDAAGNVMAVWHQSDGTRDNIWANRYTPGAGWGTASLIEVDNAGEARSPQVAMNAAGNVMAVWYQSDGTRNNIWANRFSE